MNDTYLSEGVRLSILDIKFTKNPKMEILENIKTDIERIKPGSIAYRNLSMVCIDRFQM